MDIDIRFEDTGRGGRYFVEMPNGARARLSFVNAGGGRIVADSTFVPVPYRGEGIAEALVERLFADARRNGRTVVPACWFVADEARRRSPEWDDLVAR